MRISDWSSDVCSSDLHTPYLIGFFMVGAYQEILGDMHNLFGDTNAVNVVLDGKGGWQLADPEAGDRTDELLRYVHLEPEKLSAAYRRKLDATTLPAAQRDALYAELEAGLTGYTDLSEAVLPDRKSGGSGKRVA